VPYRAEPPLRTYALRTRGGPLSFSLDALELRLRRVEGRMYFTTVSVVEVLRLQAGERRRELSSRLFESPERLRELVLDLTALRAGRPLPVHEGRRPRDRKSVV
jgi:hypothetical protein